MKHPTITVVETIRRLWRAFARALPEYEKRNLCEWRYWGTLRAKRELHSLGLEWKELAPPSDGIDEKMRRHEQRPPSDVRMSVSREASNNGRATTNK